ncbi:MAG: hypothetical protein ACLFU9_01805 [Candidatus Bathyarchaeia archaeon]
MKPLTLIYWSRAALGMIIGILCGAYMYFATAEELTGIYTLMTGLSFALLFYIATFYIIKLKFFGKVEKQSKLMTQGIGIYFFAWIVSWTLVVSLMLPSVAVGIYNNETGDLFTGQEFCVVARDSGGNIVQNVTTKTGIVNMALLPPGTYIFELGNLPENRSALEPNQMLTLNWLGSEHVTFNVTVSG